MFYYNGLEKHSLRNNWTISTQVAVDGIWKSCPRSGGLIQFPGFNGRHFCLSPSTLDWYQLAQFFCFLTCLVQVNWHVLLIMSFVARVSFVCLGSVLIHVASAEIVLMEGVTAFWGFMVMIVANVSFISLSFNFRSCTKDDTKLVLYLLSWI